jgi:hypothetical protein
VDQLLVAIKAAEDPKAAYSKQLQQLQQQLQGASNKHRKQLQQKLQLLQSVGV